MASNPPRRGCALVANYGNDSVALIQYAFEQGLSDVTVVSIDTDYAHPSWSERVKVAEAWVQSLGFDVVRLRSKLGFNALVAAQGERPLPKFAWCAVYLKGDTLRTWLSSVDPLKETKVLLARRRAQSPLFAHLQEHSEQTEEYEGRDVWHPLYLHSDAEMKALAEKVPLPLLSHRSLECDPCIHEKSKHSGATFIYDMGCGAVYGCGL